MTDKEMIDIAGNQPFCELAVAVCSKGEFIRVKHLIDIIKRRDAEIERLNNLLDSAVTSERNLAESIL